MHILYGGRRSPFVRRVSIWLTLQGQPFQREVVDVFGADFASFAAINPLSRVPALRLPDGETLIETFAIIDYLEEIAPPGKRLIPASGAARRRAMQVIACANSIAEKGVALAYEVERRPPEFRWPDWRTRLTAQLTSGLDGLEAMLPPTGWYGETDISGADIAAVIAYDFVEGIAGFDRPKTLPRLAALSASANTHPAFSSTLPPRPA